MPVSPLRRPPSILLLDGDLRTSQRLAMLLREDGFDVEVLCDGASALARLSRAPLPDVLITELSLPVTDGVESTRRQIFLYSLPLAAAAIAPWPLGLTGAVYGIAATALSLAFVALSVPVLVNRATEPAAMGPGKRLFGFSVLYLFALFAALVADRFVA